MSSSGNGQQQPPIAARLAITYAESNVQLVSIGLQMFMCIYGLISFLESPRSTRKSRVAYVIVSFTILGLSVMSTSAGNYSNFNTLLQTVPGDQQKSRAAMEKFGRGTAAYGIARISSTFIAFVGDGLLVYRCYFFWFDRKWVVILPLLVYITSVVMGFLQMLWEDVFPGWRIDFSVAWISLNAALNVLITATISFRLLVAYHKNRKYLTSRSSRVYLNIVAILVEAALPLAITGIILACFINQTQGAGAARPHQGLFRILYFFFLAISPQMIIFRVTTGRAVGRDVTRGTSGTQAQVSTGMHFGTRSSNDDTAANYDSELSRENRVIEMAKSRQTLDTEKGLDSRVKVRQHGVD